MTALSTASADVDVLGELLATARELPWQLRLWEPGDLDHDLVSTAISGVVALALEVLDLADRQDNDPAELELALDDLRIKLWLTREPLDAELARPETWGRHRLEAIARPALIYVIELGNALYRASRAPCS